VAVQDFRAKGFPVRSLQVKRLVTLRCSLSPISSENDDGTSREKRLASLALLFCGRFILGFGSSFCFFSA
jgi:hypothetical protein